MRPGHLALREPSLWRYREVLPLPEGRERVTLGEGMTPLLPARRLGRRLSLPGLLVKEEGGNPTGSFKARGLSVAVSMAKALGATDVCLPSAGYAGSALAAYAAAAGLRAHVFLPRDIARLFVMETEAYGAHVELVDGLITDAGRVCAAQAKEHGWYECATLKEPYRVEGKKTMGYEVAEPMGWTLPDAILYPTGGGTLQAEGCAPIVEAFREGREDAPLWEGAATHAHGLRVPKALGDFLILRALRESHGAAIAVSEEEIVAGVKEVAAASVLLREEGRRFFQDLPLEPQRLDLATQPRQLLALRRRQLAWLTGTCVDLRLVHPDPQRGLRQVQIPRHLRDRPPTLEHQPDRLSLELLRERPALAHGTHTRLFLGVHEIGSRPAPLRRRHDRALRHRHRLQVRREHGAAMVTP
jgi:threonine synthase